ncbi:MAG: hypothetical protein KAI64_03010 [Thermoplasmata archaeon]|nr:hypothetical protein [Thermoplasmata archaeon]
MKRGKVGKALEKAMTAPPPEPGTLKPTAQLMNPIRRDIFQHLCLYPCDNVSGISKAVGRSIHAVEWHLKKLIDEKYISVKRESNRTVYYPVGFLETRDIVMMENLNNRRIKELFLCIMRKPGGTQSEIGAELKTSHQSVGRTSEKLKALKLINTVDDGRFRRYYPSKLLKSRREGSRNMVKKFKKHILAKLESEGLNPAVMRSTDIEIIIRLVHGRGKAVLRLSCDPFATVLT